MKNRNFGYEHFNLILNQTLVILFCYIVFLPNLYGQWEAIHPSTELQSDFVHVLIPPGCNEIYALGNKTAVSSNNGASWRLIKSSSLPVQAASSVRIYFINPSEAFSIYQNKIYYTADIGITWQVMLDLHKNNSTYNSHPNFNSIYFPTPEVGYAVGTFDKIFKTTDKGKTWDTLRWNNSTLPFRNYLDVHFINKDTGYITGYEVPDILMNFGFQPFIMKTTDGGKTWDSYSMDTVFDYKGMDMQFIGENNCFVHLYKTQSIDKIFVSSDSCKTWTEISPKSLSNINCMYWIDADTGFAYGSGNQDTVFLKTTNKGTSWEKIKMPPSYSITMNTINNIVFSNDHDGVAVGEGGNILVTSDGGVTWNYKNKCFPAFYDLNFPSKNTIYGTSGLVLFKSTDAGFNWERMQSADSLQVIYDISFRDSCKGYIKGYLDRLYKTTDGAENLEYIKMPVKFYPYTSTSINLVEDTIFVIGQTIKPNSVGIIAKSTNEGQTWKIDTIFKSDANIYSVLFESKIWFVFNGDKLFSSKDNGRTWQTLSSFKTANFMTSLAYLDSITLVGTTNLNTIVRSKNLGVSWDTIASVFLAVKKIIAVNDTLLFACGIKNVENKYYGAIWKSTDTGLTWQEENLPVEVYKSVELLEKGVDYIYAAGGYGQLLRLKISNNDTTGVLSLKNPKDEKTFELFPNPATQTIYLSFPGIEKSYTGTIYDINGLTKCKIYLNQLRANFYYADTALLETGIYIISLTEKGNTYSQIFFKQ